jgi:hypothetical protein
MFSLSDEHFENVPLDCGTDEFVASHPHESFHIAFVKSVAYYFKDFTRFDFRQFVLDHDIGYRANFAPGIQ